MCGGGGVVEGVGGETDRETQADRERQTGRERETDGIGVYV